MKLGAESGGSTTNPTAAALPPFGATIDEAGVTFRLWAPGQAAVSLLIEGAETRPMTRRPDGIHEVFVKDCPEGARYRYRAGTLDFPDPASRQQDGDTAGWSIVRAPMMPAPNRQPLRPWHESVICEVHIGTVTPEGTFAALRDRLEHFRDAGYTALEIMPINEFPGARNWGYDGTLPFAPESAYGSPEELRALVDRAHALGLCLILDVVYNHFGDVDNFIVQYTPEFFDDAVGTPWGKGIAFAQAPVREFFYQNAEMWLREYDFDGLRLDSVNEIKGEGSERFLGELAARCKAVKPQAKLIVENMENCARWLERDAGNQPMLYAAQWNDDMHHVLDYLVTREGTRTGYDDRGKDPIADLAKALVSGFVNDPAEGGEDGGVIGDDLPPDSFITYVQNHDQIGNRADSKRLSERTSPERLDFAHFVKFLAPQIPLCFMGDEANLTNPFPFFVDLTETDAAPKREGRYKEMREVFHDDVADGDLPDPNDPETFASAKLPWDHFEREQHRHSLDRFRTLLGYRRDHTWPLAATPCLDAYSVRHGNCLIINWVFEGGTLSMALNPTDGPMDIACVIYSAPVWTGSFEQHGEVLRLGPWSAVAWSSRNG